MSDELKTHDPGAVWRDQPEEELPVDVKKFLSRRAVELNAATRYEILISVAAALLFVAVMAWRLAPDWDAPLLGGLALVVVWAAATLYWFRRRLRRQNDL